MNNDLISRSALKEWIDESVIRYGKRYSTDMLNMFGLFKEVIDNAPTVEPEEVAKLKRENTALEQEMLYCRENWKKAERPKGYWDKINHGDYENLDIAIRCSECLEEVDEESNYCPYCGADMRGEITNEDSN